MNQSRRAFCLTAILLVTIGTLTGGFVFSANAYDKLIDGTDPLEYIKELDVNSSGSGFGIEEYTEGGDLLSGSSTCVHTSEYPFGQGTDGVSEVAQSFTDEGELYTLCGFIYIDGSMADDVIVSLQNDNSGVPNNTHIVECTIENVYISSSMQQLCCNLSEPYSSTGKKWLVMEGGSSGNSSNHFEAAYENPVSDGNFEFRYYNTGNWYTGYLGADGVDMCYTIYEKVTPTPTPTTTSTTGTEGIILAINYMSETIFLIFTLISISAAISAGIYTIWKI